MSALESQFDDIYKTHYPKVIRLCLGYANGDKAQAKDLTQEVFIKVWQNLKAFRKESSISTWIYRITVNTCLISLRKKKTIDVSTHLNYMESINDLSDTYDKENKLNQLYSCINKLNKDNKSIILLELEGLAQKEIAEIMGLSHEAIRVRVHRIKNELIKCVKQ